MDLASTLRNFAQGPAGSVDEYPMENSEMTVRLAKLAVAIRHHVAKIAKLHRYEDAAVVFTTDPHATGPGPMLIRTHDDGRIEIFWPETGISETLDAVADPAWQAKLARRTAFGGLLPETVDADFGLKIPLTASSRSV